MNTTKKQAFIRLTIILGIVVLFNILMSDLYFRLDFTADKRYTLSQPTKDMLKNLNGPVTITAYFSEDLPPEIQILKNEFRDLLTEYNKRSGNMVMFSFVNPAKDEKTKQMAQRKGIQPLLSNVRKKDKFQQQEVYLGAYVQYGEKSEVIPAIQPGAPMEYALTYAISKCSMTEKPFVGIVQGQNEANTTRLSVAIEVLSAIYTIETIELNDTNEIPEKFNSIAIINPEDSFTKNQLESLDQFIQKGGNIFIAYGYIKGDISSEQPGAYLNSTGLENWLLSKGIRIKPNLVFDNVCAQIGVQQRQGDAIFNVPVQFPYIPFFSQFADHPITKGLETVVLPFASELDVSGIDTNKIKATYLIKSSRASGTKLLPISFNINEVWTEADFNRSNIPVAIALEGNIYGDNKTKMVVISNGDFALTDEKGQLKGSPDDLNFLANAIDWLSDESGLSELRTKSISARPIDQLSESRKTFIKYVNVFLPIVLIILLGIMHYRVQNRRRKKWMGERIK